MVGVLLLNNSIINLCNDIKLQSENIELKLANSEFNDAYYQSLELLNLINEKNLLTSIYLSHQEFDNLLNEALKLSTYLSHEDETEAHASLHLVKYNADHIKKLQMLNLENIL
jgi:hypothetical protein